MNDADTKALAHELEIEHTWYEVGIGHPIAGGLSAVIVDALTATTARAMIRERLQGVAAKVVALDTLGGGVVVLSSYDVRFVNDITPALRRGYYLRELLERREERAVRAEHKKFGDDEDDE